MEEHQQAIGPSSRDRQVLSRRGFLATSAIVGAGLAVGSSFVGASAASASAGLSAAPRSAGMTTQIGDVIVRGVEFQNNDITMSGNVYLPAGFNERQKYPAIVVVHPGGGVKEQVAGLYALKLAEEGFVTLAFDASHQGASGGMPRFVDDPMKRVVDFYSAVDYLTSLPYVDVERVGALGACAGSGIAVKASMTERRIKALATVSAVDVGAATRKGWEDNTPESAMIPTLEAVAKQRLAEAAGAAPVYVPYVPNLGDTTAPRDLQEAADYYLTARGQYPTSTNQMLMTSISTLASFTGFEGADTFITQPLLMIAGSEAGSLWHSQELNRQGRITAEGALHHSRRDAYGPLRWRGRDGGRQQAGSVLQEPPRARLTASSRMARSHPCSILKTLVPDRGKSTPRATPQSFLDHGLNRRCISFRFSMPLGVEAAENRVRDLPITIEKLIEAVVSPIPLGQH